MNLYKALLLLIKLKYHNPPRVRANNQEIFLHPKNPKRQHASNKPKNLMGVYALQLPSLWINTQQLNDFAFRNTYFVNLRLGEASGTGLVNCGSLTQSQ